MVRSLLRSLALLSLPMALHGCAIGALAGGMAQNYEYQKLLDVPPEYDGLESRRTAVVVYTGLATLYEFPQLAGEVAAGIAFRLQRDVPGIQILSPDVVIAWQFNTAQWNAMPFGDIARLSMYHARPVYLEVSDSGPWQHVGGEWKIRPTGDDSID